jgi:DNA (cytosine-5)-methyltransferase 1
LIFPNWSSETLRVLDLFCGEGGAAKGYDDAGLTVVGVDSNPDCLKRYPYSAYLGSWDDGLKYWLERVEIHLIHASPPCQRYSQTARLHPHIDYPDLVPPVREALRETGIPYVIENVPQAPLTDPAYLCGSMFQLGGWWKGEFTGLDRKRGFEAPFPIIAPLDCSCSEYQHTIPLFGHGCPSNRPWFRGPGFADLTREAMQIDWMTRDGLTEAIPPKFAEFVGYSFQCWRGHMLNVPARCPETRHDNVFDHVS